MNRFPLCGKFKVGNSVEETEHQERIENVTDKVVTEERNTQFVSPDKACESFWHQAIG